MSSTVEENNMRKKKKKKPQFTMDNALPIPKQSAAAKRYLIRPTKAFFPIRMDEESKAKHDTTTIPYVYSYRRFLYSSPVTVTRRASSLRFMEHHGNQSPRLTTLTSRGNAWEGPYRLLYCSSKGDKAGVMEELESGVTTNLADYDKRTALHLASCEGCTEIVVLLLERGADVNFMDRWGRTALSDARSFGHKDICKILEAHGGIDPIGVDSQSACCEIDWMEVDMNEATLIGEGAYGEVYLVKWRGTEVAAKTIRSSIASNKEVKDNFLKELALWAKLRHPNIVQFLGVLKHPNRLIFLTEYLKNGSLYDILRRRGRLDALTAVAYGLDIARGMNYLHQHRPHAIIHRDLTPSNVLQTEAGRLKVTDFGLSKITQGKDVGYKMTGGTGSFRYMAPEVYRRESYGKSVDVFSFALVVHEMFQGGPSNRGHDPQQLADKRAYEHIRPHLPSMVYPQPIKKLLQDCWHRNPDLRPSFGEIIQRLESIQENLLQKASGCCSWMPCKGVNNDVHA